MLIKQTREPLVVSLVALKQHGNHGCTPRDWPLQRKWKSQRKDKIPWANKVVILPNLLLKTSWDKTLVLCWGYWVSIQCRVERQRMLSWLISGKQMQCQKELKVVDSVQTQICPHGVPERKKKRNISDSYIHRRVWDCDHRFCYCGLSCSLNFM